MNIWDIIIVVLVALVLCFALGRIFTRKGGCSCGCSECNRPCSQRSGRDDEGPGTE